MLKVSNSYIVSIDIPENDNDNDVPMMTVLKAKDAKTWELVNMLKGENALRMHELLVGNESNKEV